MMLTRSPSMNRGSVPSPPPSPLSLRKSTSIHQMASPSSRCQGKSNASILTSSSPARPVASRALFGWGAGGGSDAGGGATGPSAAAGAAYGGSFLTSSNESGASGDHSSLFPPPKAVSSSSSSAAAAAVSALSSEASIVAEKLMQSVFSWPSSTSSSSANLVPPTSEGPGSQKSDQISSAGPIRDISTSSSTSSGEDGEGGALAAAQATACRVLENLLDAVADGTTTAADLVDAGVLPALSSLLGGGTSAITDDSAPGVDGERDNGSHHHSLSVVTVGIETRNLALEALCLILSHKTSSSSSSSSSSLLLEEDLHDVIPGVMSALEDYVAYLEKAASMGPSFLQSNPSSILWGEGKPDTPIKGAPRRDAAAAGDREDAWQDSIDGDDGGASPVRLAAYSGRAITVPSSLLSAAAAASHGPAVFQDRATAPPWLASGIGSGAVVEVRSISSLGGSLGRLRSDSSVPPPPRVIHKPLPSSPPSSALGSLHISSSPREKPGNAAVAAEEEEAHALAIATLKEVEEAHFQWMEMGKLAMSCVVRLCGLPTPAASPSSSCSSFSSPAMMLVRQGIVGTMTRVLSLTHEAAEAIDGMPKLGGVPTDQLVLVALFRLCYPPSSSSKGSSSSSSGASGLLPGHPDHHHHQQQQQQQQQQTLSEVVFRQLLDNGGIQGLCAALLRNELLQAPPPLTPPSQEGLEEGKDSGKKKKGAAGGAAGQVADIAGNLLLDVTSLSEAPSVFESEPPARIPPPSRSVTPGSARGGARGGGLVDRSLPSRSAPPLVAPLTRCQALVRVISNAQGSYARMSVMLAVGRLAKHSPALQMDFAREGLLPLLVKVLSPSPAPSPSIVSPVSPVSPFATSQEGGDEALSGGEGADGQQGLAMIPPASRKQQRRNCPPAGDNELLERAHAARLIAIIAQAAPTHGLIMAQGGGRGGGEGPVELLIRLLGEHLEDLTPTPHVTTPAPTIPTLGGGDNVTNGGRTSPMMSPVTARSLGLGAGGGGGRKGMSGLMEALGRRRTVEGLDHAAITAEEAAATITAPSSSPTTAWSQADHFVSPPSSFLSSPSTPSNKGGIITGGGETGTSRKAAPSAAAVASGKAVVRHMVSSLTVVSQNPSTHFELVGMGACPLLVGLVKSSQDPQVRSHALACLTTIVSLDPRHAAVAARAGALPVVISLLREQSAELRGEGSRQEGDDGGVSRAAPVAPATAAGGLAPGEMCTSLVASFCRYRDIQAEFADANGIEALLQLLHHLVTPSPPTARGTSSFFSGQGGEEGNRGDRAANVAEALTLIAASGAPEHVLRLCVHAPEVVASCKVLLSGGRYGGGPSGRYWAATLMRVLASVDPNVAEEALVQGLHYQIVAGLAAPDLSFEHNEGEEEEGGGEGGAGLSVGRRDGQEGTGAAAAAAAVDEACWAASQALDGVLARVQCAYLACTLAGVKVEDGGAGSLLAEDGAGALVRAGAVRKLVGLLAEALGAAKEAAVKAADEAAEETAWGGRGPSFLRGGGGGAKGGGGGRVKSSPSGLSFLSGRGGGGGGGGMSSSDPSGPLRKRLEGINGGFLFPNSARAGKDIDAEWYLHAEGEILQGVQREIQEGEGSYVEGGQQFQQGAGAGGGGGLMPLLQPRPTGMHSNAAAAATAALLSLARNGGAKVRDAIDQELLLQAWMTGREMTLEGLQAPQEE